MKTERLRTGAGTSVWRTRSRRVTPRDGLVFADEPIYFLTKRTPPAGLELHYTHKVHLPPAEAALLHILSEADEKRLVQTEKICYYLYLR